MYLCALSKQKMIAKEGEGRMGIEVRSAACGRLLCIFFSGVTRMHAIQVSVAVQHLLQFTCHFENMKARFPLDRLQWRIPSLVGLQNPAQCGATILLVSPSSPQSRVH
jgi:hypothetical protein